MKKKELEAHRSQMFSIVKLWNRKKDKMDIQDFCQEQGISISKLRYWIAKYEKKQNDPFKYDSVWLDLMYKLRLPIFFICINALVIFFLIYTSKTVNGSSVFNPIVGWLCGLIVVPSIIFLYIASDKNETDRATFHDSSGNTMGYLVWNTGRIIKGNAGCGAFLFMAYVIIYLLGSIYHWIWGL
jgi:hypothetical protein